MTNLGSLNSYKIMGVTDPIDTCCQAKFSTIFQSKPCHSVSSFEIAIADNFTQIVLFNISSYLPKIGLAGANLSCPCISSP